MSILPDPTDQFFASEGGSAFGSLLDAPLATTKPSFSVAQAAAQIGRENYTWYGDFTGAAHSTVVTYGFRASAPTAAQEEAADASGFTRFSAQEITQAQRALQAWSDVAGITFVRVGTGTSGDDAYTDDATMLFGNYTTGSDGAAGFAYFPGNPSAGDSDGDVFLNGTLNYNLNASPSNYGGSVLIHEIGHTFGLSHPGDYDAGDGTPTYANNAEYAETVANTP